MIRLIGILTGSALGIAMLILAFGLPELPPEADEPPLEPAVQPAPPIEAPSVETPSIATAEPEAAKVAPPEARELPPPETLVETPSPAPEEAVALPIDEPAPVAPPIEEPAPVTPPVQNWYAFWSPFRSRIAADGFVAELQRTTGLDYRVVKLKPGIYEVAFAYTDDADIRDKLDRISAATGMDMSGG